MKPKHVPGRLLSGLLTLCLTAFTLAPLASVQAAPTFQLLHAFGDYPSGFSPVGELVQATDGNLYGTARYGGSGGTGTVFKLKTDGTGFAVILSIPYSDGSPSAGLIQGTDGYLYGTTRSSSGNIAGTVFKVKTNGTGYVVLKDFDYFTNGADPGTRLIQGTDGTLYGTAARGGIGDAGTVFKLKPDGTGFAVLRSFDGSATGGLPSGVVQSTDGNLYGVTRDGGSNNSGTVFKLKTDGTGFAVLVNFDYSTKGANPVAGLNQGADGYLYGTAPSGGSNEAGTVFRLNPDGTGFAVIKPLSFPASAGPYGGVIQGTDGNLYGLATGGGADGLGALYQLKPDGADFSVLANFDYYTTGGFPNYALIQGKDGNLYGTTDQGGASGGGTAFRLVFPNLKDRKQEVQQALSALLPSGNKETDKRLQKAIDGIAKSLNPALWKDGNHLATKDGQKVFEGEKQAVQVLTEVWNDKKTPARVVTAAGDAIDKLVIIDIDLATTAMADAMTAGGNGKKLAEATRELGRAAAADQAGKADEAIDHARKAWEKAQESLKK